jgi:hypothetical protein
VVERGAFRFTEPLVSRQSPKNNGWRNKTPKRPSKNLFESSINLWINHYSGSTVAFLRSLCWVAKLLGPFGGFDIRRWNACSLNAMGIAWGEPPRSVLLMRGFSFFRLVVLQLLACGHAHGTSDSLILMSHAYNHFRWFACHITSVCCHFSWPLFFSYPSSYAKLGKKTFN